MGSENKSADQQFSATMFGKVTCGATGKAVPGAEVRFALVDEMGMRFTHTIGHADANGDYDIPISWSGCAEPAIHSQTLGEGIVSLVGMLGDPEMHEPRRLRSGDRLPEDMELNEGFTLEVHATDEEGNPVQGAGVNPICTNDQSCWWPMADQIGQAEPGYKLPETDADGICRVVGVPVDMGDYHFVVSVIHEVLAEVLIFRPEELPRKNGTARVDVVLEVGCELTGRVIDAANGDPVAAAEVIATVLPPPDGTPPCHRMHKHATTDADGTFAIPGLLARPHMLNVEHPDYRELEKFDVPVDEAGELELALTTGRSVSGRVVGDDGAALAEVAVRAITVETLSNGVVMSRTVKETLTDADGRYKLAGLPEGERIWVEAAQKCDPQEPDRCCGLVEWTDQESVDFDTRELVHVSGVVRDPDTDEPYERQVFCLLVGLEESRGLTYAIGSQMDGQFAMGIPPDGKFSLALRSSGSPFESDFFKSVPLVTSGGDSIPPLDLIGDKPLTLTIRVVNDATGEPVPDVAVNVNPIKALWNAVFGGRTDEQGLCVVKGIPHARVAVWSEVPDVGRDFVPGGVELPRDDDSPIELRLKPRAPSEP